MPNLMHDYFAKVGTLVSELERHQSQHIEAAARMIARSLANEGILHVFGSGHSLLPAVEVYARAGGLAAVDLVFDPALSPTSPARCSMTERLHDYAEVSLSLAELRAGEVMIVISNSGINPVPVEAAIGARDRGLSVIAVTSVAHSQAVNPRHRSGRRLCEIADIVIDTGTPIGDTTVNADGLAVGPVSTILASTALHAITAHTAQLLGEPRLPVLVSQNIDRGDHHNEQALARYAGRITGS